MSSDIKANKVAFCYATLHLLETVAGNSHFFLSWLYKYY